MALPRKGMWTGGWGVFAVVGCAAFVWVLTADVSRIATAPQVMQAWGRLPLAFEPSQGQDRVDFLARGPGYTLLLSSTEAALRFAGGAAVTMRLVAAASPMPEAERVLTGRRHYLLGADPGHWHTGIPTYGAVRYRGVYPGVDLVYYGRQEELEYDFVVAPGADPHAVRLAFRGAVPILAADGSLILNTHAGAMVQHPPRAYQIIHGRMLPVPAHYMVDGVGMVSVQLAAYDARLPLVIDPALSFSSYLGGVGTDRVWAISVDDSGAMYVAGETTSADLGSMGGVTAGGTDAFVAKFNPGGNLEYVTYLGGAGTDRAYAVAVDATHNVYVAGDTDSSDFPALYPLAGLTGGGTDAFVAKIDASGAGFIFAARLGGGGADSARGLAIDGTGAAYVVGATTSADFPVTESALQKDFKGATTDQGVNANGFVAKLEFDAGTHILSRAYATYLGGTGPDNVAAVAVDSSGNAYVAGMTVSNITSFLGANKGGNGDAFVAKLNPTGTGLVYGYYLGGPRFERATALAIDNGGNAYVTGMTSSDSGFPLSANAHQRTYGGGSFDAFVVRVTSGGVVDYSSYLGGEDNDQANGIAVDSFGGQVYIVGETQGVPPDPFNPLTPIPNNTFPLAQAVQGSRDGLSDAFITVLSTNGGTPVFSTYYGGAGTDQATATALGPSGALYVAGYSTSTDLPTVSAPQAVNKGDDEAFVARFSLPGATADLAISAASVPETVRLKSPYIHRIEVANTNGPDAATGVVVRDTLPAGLLFQSATGDCTAADGTVTCRLSDIAVGQAASVDITVTPDSGGPLTAIVQVLRAQQSDPDASNNSATVKTTITVGDSGGGAWGMGLLLLVWAWALRWIGRHRVPVLRQPKKESHAV